MTASPSPICRAGPRGPSGVRVTAPPDFSHFRASRRAWDPPLAFSGLSFFWDEPRMAGKPSRATASAMNCPSGDREMSARTGWPRPWSQAAGARPMRECQKAMMTGPPPAQAASTRSRFSWRQRMVAKHSRIQPRHQAAENPLNHRIADRPHEPASSGAASRDCWRARRA